MPVDQPVINIYYGEHQSEGTNKIEEPVESATRILKQDDERHLVTGVVLEPETVDAHGDVISADEIEATAHNFMVSYGTIGIQHNAMSKGALMVESWITKSAQSIEGQKVKKGAWLITVWVPDDNEWEAVKEGKFTGFSVGGFGERIEE